MKKTIKTILSARNTDMTTTVRVSRSFQGSTDVFMSVATYRKACRRLGLIGNQHPRELLAINGNDVIVELH